LILGVASGALASGLSIALYATEDLFAKLPVHWMWWPAIGGLAVGLGGLIEPRVLGVGYDVIGDLLHQQLAVKVAIAILVVKAVIWVIALGSGTSGGVLAPLLMLGAGLGIVMGPILPGHEAGLWPLVAMAATLGATLGAPLTAIVFAFGLTHDANALLPLLTATLVAHGFTTVVMRRSIMTEKIARRGYHIYREYGVDPLERHHVDEVMTRSVRTIDAAVTVGEALASFFGPSQTHRAYPVVRAERLVGVADRDTLVALATEQGSEMAVGDALAAKSITIALASETCRLVAARLAVHGLERVPVVADRDSMKLEGIVSRSDLVKPSRMHFEEEQKKERFRRVGWRSAKRRS
jgi:CBS domain-containing protein